MPPITVNDATPIQQLFEVAELYRAKPDSKVSGAAIQGLRLLFLLTVNWLETLEGTLKPGEQLPDDQLPAGLPNTIADAEAMHRYAAEVILEVLDIRYQQRKADRIAGVGPIFTSPDLAALKLRMSCTGLLTPVPARMQRPTPTKQRKSATPEPTAPAPSTPNPTTHELDADDLAAQQLDADDLAAQELAADIQRMLEPASQSTGNKTTAKEITKTRPNGRRIQKQLRHRPQPASVA